VTILEAMIDPKLFGPWFTKRWASWARWRVFLSALFGLPLDEEEMKVYSHHTGRTVTPNTQAREAWIVAGRRAGKSRIVALVGAYLAAFFDYRAFLDHGEFGVVVIVASDKSQARVIFSYIRSFFLLVPMLKKKVLKVKEADKIIELKGGISIEVHAGSFRASRGFTIVAALLDEIAFWRTEEEGSANPDVEIVRAIKPGMLTIPNAMMVALSSPYAQRGALWAAYRKHFAKDGDPVLVWQGTTLEMHPSVNKELIDEAYTEDESAARAEYGAEFRQDVAAYISAEALEQCIIPHRIELPPFAAGEFRAFTDPSGGMGDSFTLAIGHTDIIQDKARYIIDAVREHHAPFSPEQVIVSLCETLKQYRVTEVTGDRYAARYNSEQFQKNGIAYHEAEFVRSDLYLNALALLNSGQCELPDIPRLKAQILGLDRITGRGGKDRVDHGPRGHDDVANAVLGLLATMVTTPEPEPVGLVRLIVF
jgi:hypothetical protein